jgi:SET and MYND domain-containing protein
MYSIINTDKGRGLYASVDIPKDTIIIKEKPSIISEDAYDCVYKLYIYDSEYDDKLMLDYKVLVPTKIDKYIIDYDQIQKDIKTLPDYMREFFENFDKNKLRILLAKFHRNAFTYSSYHGGGSALLFTGNILNHSCAPNVDFFVDNYGYFIFVTNRAIKKDEELCNKYINVNLSFKKRQKTLLDQYGFVCECEKCISNNCLNCC